MMPSANILKKYLAKIVEKVFNYLKSIICVFIGQHRFLFIFYVQD